MAYAPRRFFQKGQIPAGPMIAAHPTKMGGGEGGRVYATPVATRRLREGPVHAVLTAVGLSLRRQSFLGDAFSAVDVMVAARGSVQRIR